ncbi:HAD family acid phosphatase [Hyphococcus flavus]|uniref:HAD family acid phosphatase n=1 Tax=Hyphococcus flavus TaxID=1866326 RepID=A0AAF0CF91_9PROT|nr:HAD family acid phosphatase [Hyphococcus flavus]WDI32276.1 HAD family acid phosphatase [Hyphococcus flavus]
MPHHHISFSRFIATCAAIFMLAGCATTPVPDAPSGPAPDDRLNATLWMQQAVEYKAATETVYALASKRLDEALADRSWTAAPAEQGAGYENLPPAIILDADETVIDNSPFQAMMVTTGAGFSEDTWNDWARDEKAMAVPGALQFTQEAAAKGVTVFYVTNRSEVVDGATTRNLAALGFPMKAGEDTVLTKTDTSKKGVRRAMVTANYRVLLLIGDNFGDFVDDYKGTPTERQQVYDANAERWGREWLVLPNPSYGSWESSAFGDDYSLSPEEQRQMKLDQLKAWRPKGE